MLISKMAILTTKNETAAGKPCVARVATVSMFFNNHLSDQISYIDKSGIKQDIITSDSDKVLIDGDFINKISIKIPRKPSPFDDIVSLARLSLNYIRNNYDITHSNTPKAGLLNVLSSKIARVPVVLHTFTGQPWATMTGAKRRFYILIDRIIAALSTRCYADSESQANFLVENKIAKKGKIMVIGKGSLAGVNTERFDRANINKNDLAATEKLLHQEGMVTRFLFVGRITKEKGIYELLSAFNSLVDKYPDIQLVLVGPLESDMPEKDINGYHNVVYAGQTPCPEKFYAVSDVLCIPSYREGFGTVVIEAACMGLPAIGTRINGLIDAIVEGETGLLVEKQDSVSLAAAMEQLHNNADLRKQMGENAKKRALRDYDSSVISKQLLEEYMTLYEEMLSGSRC